MSHPSEDKLPWALNLGVNPKNPKWRRVCLTNADNPNDVICVFGDPAHMTRGVADLAEMFMRLPSLIVRVQALQAELLLAVPLVESTGAQLVADELVRLRSEIEAALKLMRVGPLVTVGPN